MPDRPFKLKLDCRANLETSMPVSDRDPGVLVEAPDLSGKFIGPRRGDSSFTRCWEGPGTAALYDKITFTTGASTFATGVSYEDQFRDLGTAFTLDLYFRLSAVAYASGKDEIGLYSFLANSLGKIDVTIMGPNSTDHERIRVRVITTNTRIVADTAVTITGTTRIQYGTDQINKQHVRVVRDGKNLYLYLNGVLDASSSSLVATSPLYATLGTKATVLLGKTSNLADPTVTLKGNIYGAILRDGAFTSQPIEATMPCAPWAPNVHHYYIGRAYPTSSLSRVFDASRYGAHATISGSNYSVVSANDNTAPAPAIVQGIKTWTTKTNRTATSVLCGGVLSTAIVS